MSKYYRKKPELILRKLKRLHEIAADECNALEKEIGGLPGGKLIIHKSGNRYKFYVRNGDAVKSISKTDELVKKLARRLVAVEDLNEAAALESCLEDAIEQIMLGRKSGNKRGLKTAERIREIFDSELLHRNINERRWFRQHPKAQGFYPEGLKYRTRSGLYVRSKSERMIANLLDEYGIVYVYEARMDLDSGFLVPDFTIYRYDGTTIIWEHFGLMNDENYRKNAKQKMKTYRDIGFSINTNLICTTEEDMLSEDDVRKIIEERLL